MKILRRALYLAVGVAVLAVMPILVACGDKQTGGANVNVTLGGERRFLGEWVVKPDPSSVPAGEVKFTVNNKGIEEHGLIILKTDFAHDALPTKDDGSANEEAPGIEEVGRIKNIEPGKSSYLTVTLEPGNYVLLCNKVLTVALGSVASHYKEGMHAAFTVQ
ncbi:MAG: hypothetical protein HY663_02920 [Chloroflexi bacterium]|nr:hypothetical protein [Chloroflexota bacterium]